MVAIQPLDIIAAIQRFQSGFVKLFNTSEQNTTSKNFFFQMPIKFLELKGKPATWDCIVNKLPSEIFFDFLNMFCLKSIYLALNFEEFALS